MTASYTATGPFANGGAPGLSAQLFNNIESYLDAINTIATANNIGGDDTGAVICNTVNFQVAAVVLNGSTSGTVSLYQPLAGTINLVILLANNFKNGGGSAQTMTLPHQFIYGLRFWTGDTNTFTLKSGATTQNVGIITTFAAGGGTATVQSNVNSYSVGDCFAAVDTISFNGSAASAHSGISILFGI